ncbi:Rv0804 family intramembrane glutamic endopeptidase [Mycolicibacterium mengxianglii]|uniref:Rv0804 family intramembrane glutamic endopeptidase n=1 Tax=Mycolicibacterium mengxianglii TaxID=2736649 RepID=UPI0018D072EB|nr:CPBP family intramembrane glutamic endopeptidase [Mycolicibacterium mengxianglii]
MVPNTERLRTLGLAAGLVAYSATARWQIPGRHHPVVQAALGSALAKAAGARAGLRGTPLRAGLGEGGAAAAVVAAAVAAGIVLPPVRRALRQRDVPPRGWRWLAVDIPLGTVWAEEAAYRGALGTWAGQAFGAHRGRLLQATAFGLSHVIDARRGGDPVVGTVLVTGAAGWIFAVLAERTGSLLAPALAHLAINEAGAVAALVVQHNRY